LGSKKKQLLGDGSAALSQQSISAAKLHENAATLYQGAERILHT
jgi:hypothetical protein